MKQFCLRSATSDDLKYLYDIMQQRMAEPQCNISHRKMPTWDEHVRFYMCRPYHAWYIVLVDDIKAGTCYLTEKNEIGIHLIPEYRGKGLGGQIVNELIRLYPRKQYLANISPDNEFSQRMFEKLGFKLIQYTYERKS
jgi:RimJ/RimL family protein N-acetyltransferase